MSQETENYMDQLPDGNADENATVTKQEMEKILRQSAYSLPNDPTARGWTPEEIKKTYYMPLLHIVSLMRSLEVIIGEKTDDLDEACSALEESIKALETKSNSRYNSNFKRITALEGKVDDRYDAAIAAVNSCKTALSGSIGSTFALKTQNKSDLVSAINEVVKILEDIYDKTDIEALLSASKRGRFIEVDELPTEDIDDTSIYLVPKPNGEGTDTRDEYIHFETGWERVGNTAVDLSGYVQQNAYDAENADLHKALEGIRDTLKGMCSKTEVEGMVTKTLENHVEDIVQITESAVIQSDQMQEVISDTSAALKKADEANAIAKQANFAKGFPNYQALIYELVDAPADRYKVGQSFFIETMNVPDLWVSGVEEYPNLPTELETSDEDFAELLGGVDYVVVGYYRLSKLETLTQDLTNYVKKTDYASTREYGVVKLGGREGIIVDGDGILKLAPTGTDHINSRKGTHALTLNQLDYAVVSVLKGGHITPTVNDISLIQTFLGIGRYKHTIMIDFDFSGLTYEFKRKGSFTFSFESKEMKKYTDYNALINAFPTYLNFIPVSGLMLNDPGGGSLMNITVTGVALTHIVISPAGIGMYGQELSVKNNVATMTPYNDGLDPRSVTSITDIVVEAWI